MTTSINPQIFREYDIRGLVDKDLTARSSTRSAAASARWSDAPTRASTAAVAVGRDARESSVRFRDALCLG